MISLDTQLFNFNRSSSSKLGPTQSATAQQRLKFDDSVFFRSPVNEGSSHKFMKRTVSLSSNLVAENRAKIARLTSYTEYEATPPPASSAQSGRKRYPSFEDYDSLKLELEKVKMELVTKEAECLEAQNGSQRAEDKVGKMEFAVRY